MNVASTELSDLCKKVFEGMGFPLGDYEDCAQAITWLEMHGLPILDELHHNMPSWTLSKSQAATILFEDETIAAIDAHKNDGLVYGSLAMDLAYLKALHTGLAVVKLQRVHHCRLIIPHAVHCAQRGMNVVVFWREGDQEHVVNVQADGTFPYYTIYQLSTLPDDPQHTYPLSSPYSLTILCMTNESLTPQIPNKVVSKARSFCMTPEDFAAHYQHHIEVGLEVDEAIWARLVLLSENVLVESTTLSRMRGAGESATGKS